MDRPPAHHPDCTCADEDTGERVVSASNTLISFASELAAGHRLCSYNILVAAFFLIEYVTEVCDAERDDETVTKARDTAKKFYDYSSEQWENSNRRKMN